MTRPKQALRPMATVSKNIADRLIKGGGWLDGPRSAAPDNPRAVLIVEYDNFWGGVSYGVTYEDSMDRDRYLRASEFVIEPRVYWRARGQYE